MINKNKSSSLRKNSELTLMNNITNKFENKKNKSLSTYSGAEDNNIRLESSKRKIEYLQT